MIKRTLYFGNPTRLKLQLMQLVAEFSDKPDEHKSIPVEDIGIVVLDHAQITISHGLMNALIGNNAAVLFCDAHHLPNGLILPLAGNHVFTEKLRFQLEASEPLKKQLWKQTIQFKIRNQAAVLASQGIAIKNMLYWADSVGSGDPDNYEGRAAAYYWRSLNFTTPPHDNYAVGEDLLAAEPLTAYGNLATNTSEKPEFKRHRFGDSPNNMLNYGYAVLRAVVARSLVASGFLPALGIHHRNKYNAYCLADDIMEPYRPYVDQLVIKILSELEELPQELDKNLKAKLLVIPTLDVEIDGQNSPLMVAMQRTTASLMRCFEGESRKIVYPIL